MTFGQRHAFGAITREKRIDFVQPGMHDPGVRRRETGTQFDRALEQFARPDVGLRIELLQLPEAAMKRLPRAEVIRQCPNGTILLGAGHRRFDRHSDRAGNFILHREHVADVAVVPLGPHVASRLRLDQLGVHPHPIRAAPRRTLPSST